MFHKLDVPLREMGMKFKSESLRFEVFISHRLVLTLVHFATTRLLADVLSKDVEVTITNPYFRNN